jgi:hypothetical protein
VVHDPVQHLLQCSEQLFGGIWQESLQWTSHCAFAVVAQSSVGCFCLQTSTVG